MKLLLINPILPEYFSRSHILPFGYLSLEAWLTANGHEVDLLFPEYNLWREKQIIEYISKSRPDIIGMGGFFDWLNVAAKLSRLIRDEFPDIKQIFGGVMATPNPELCFKIAPIDYVCRGEGELPLQKLLDSLEQGGDSEGIPGICVYKDGAFIDGGYGETVDLEKMPDFNFDKIQMGHYAYNWQLKSQLNPYSFPVGFFMTSRGCPYNCSFCFSVQKYRRVEMDTIFKRLDTYVERFRPTYMMFSDDTFCAQAQWTLEFCRRLKEKNYGFNYYCTGRVNTFTNEMAKALSESGCSMVHLALENADDAILERMNKKITFDRFMECVEIARRHNIVPNVSAMIGHPGETRESVLKTIETLLNLMDHQCPYNFVSYFKLKIYPGMPLFEEARKMGLFTDDFDFYRRHFSNRGPWMCDVSEDKVNQITPIVISTLNSMAHLYRGGISKENLNASIQNTLTQIADML